MVPFQVDPSWYEDYWLSEQPRRRRRISLARLIGPALRIGRNLWTTRSSGSQDASAAAAACLAQPLAGLVRDSANPSRQPKVKAS
jgi:hypothetical protein